jgi:peptide/nickel transport system ATP-binding protein
LLRLVDPSAGAIRFDGVEIGKLSQREVRPYRRRMQMIFQDPFGSLNPRHTVGEILSAPLAVHGFGDRAERRRRVAAIVERVGLPAGAIHRYPHEFSGGQRQRIGSPARSSWNRNW